jgi:signal transduction histidine kinase
VLRCGFGRASHEEGFTIEAILRSGWVDTEEPAIDPAARGLLNVARSVLGDLDLEVVLARVLESAQALTGARYAALGVLDPAREQLARFLTRGIDEEDRARIGPLPRGRGVLGELIDHPVPLRLRDVSSHPRSYGFPAGHPPMRSFLGVPIVIDGHPYGNLYLTDKPDAAQFTAEDAEAVILLAEFAGVAIDHARRYTGTEQQRVQLQSTVDALEATIEIARALAGQTDLQAILELVAKRGRALVSARTLVIELGDQRELLIAAGAGELPEDFVGRRVGLEKTVASTAMRTRQTQRLSDQLNWSRFIQHGAGRFDLRAHDGLVVPLLFRNESYGALVALDRLESGPAFSAQDQRLLESFAASSAMAVATAQSAADERRRQTIAAAEAERGRWARELHDETLQALASVRLILAAARRTGEAGALAEAVDHAVGQLQSDMDNLRALITDLRPGALDELGVEAAIVDLVGRLGSAGVAVDVDIDMAYEQGRAAERLVPELETAVYRTVQEALTNASKHSEAKRAVVEVIEDGPTLRVSIRDDGAGFDPERDTSGFGLLGIRERVELCEGELGVDSAPGRGTTITASFPIRRRRHEPGPVGEPATHG